jgi:hypothetical protein
MSHWLYNLTRFGGGALSALGYWKGNRAGGGAALLTSVTSNADKVWVVYLQA